MPPTIVFLRPMTATQLPSGTITMSKLPSAGSGVYAWNGTAFIQDNVVTADGYQYAIHANAFGHAVISQRTIPDGVWSQLDLSNLAGAPLGSSTGLDSHNDYSIAVDADGYIHVSGNHHNDALRYIRSTNPHDITTWTTASMTGSNQDSVTYPRFVRLPDNTLLFVYRNGMSGAGNTYINVYNTATKTWSARAHPWIDGNASGESAYLNTLAVGADGSLHAFMCWRASGTADTNNDLCYATSPDGGVSWQQSAGAAYTLPLTHASIEKVIDTPATGSGILNQNGATVDANGRPHTVCFQYDGSGYTQLHHVWHDGTAWQNQAVTSFTYRYDLSGPSVDGSLARPTIVAIAGKVYILYRHNVAHPGQVRAYDVTNGRHFTLLDIDTVFWEPTVDQWRARNGGELTFLVNPLVRTGSTSPGFNHADNWERQYAGIVEVDADALAALSAGQRSAPTLSMQSSSVLGSAATITATAFSVVAGVAAITVDSGADSGTLFARLTVTGSKGTATTLSVRIKETRTSDSVVVSYGTIPITGTGETKRTPWIPLRNLSALVPGSLQVEAMVNAGSATLSAATLELGWLTI